MLARKQLAAIHMAKNSAHLDDQQYRLVLVRNAGVSSAKDLNPGDFSKVLNAINNEGKRSGWQWRQIWKFRQYCKYCGLNKTQGNVFIYRTIFVMNDESPYLGNIEFDIVMAQIEEKLEHYINDGKVAKPQNINLQYWRGKCPRQAMINSRQLHKIRTIFSELKLYLDEAKQNESYLLGLVARVCNQKLSRLKDIAAIDAIKVIEALKEKLQYEQQKDTVPF